MRKFSFFIPLVILTLAITGLTFLVRSYQKDDVVTPTQVTDSTEQIPVDGSDQIEVTPPQKETIFSRIFGGRKQTTTVNNETTAQITVTPVPINTSFNSSNVEVPIDQERIVSIYVTEGKDVPTAFTFNAKFDPKSIQVVKIEPGDVWEKAAVFERGNKIDNIAGTFTYSAGQSLNTQKANGKTLIKIYVKAKATASLESELTIENTSKFAFVGLDYAVPLTAQSIQISVTK
jgi:hypothetical protein